VNVCSFSCFGVHARVLVAFGGIARKHRGDGSRREVIVTKPYVVRYVGGPLDGRVDTLPELPEQPRDTVTHVHLHEGPKIVHHYDLCYAVEYGCEYRVREIED
jgi:hypothetical protein